MKASFFFVCAALMASPTFAAKPERNLPGSGQTREASQDPWLKVTISAPEAATLRRYYSSEPTAKLPLGLQKKAARGKSLPPGWQKKLARGAVLDADIYREAEVLPAIILRELPPQPAGTVLIRLEGKIVRLAQATREIIDILDL